MDIKLLVNSAYDTIYQLDHFPEGVVKGQIQSELEDILALNNPAVLKRRLNYVGIGDIADYENKWIQTPYGYVLAGIRHMGGNLNKPFIYVWPCFVIEDLNGLIECLRPYFEIFDPLYINFWMRPDLNDGHYDVYQQRFIGLINQMPSSDKTLIKPDNYYDWYANVYAKFHEQNPDLIDRITVNEQALMDRSYDQDLLYVLVEEDQWMGLIAGERCTFMGQDAIYLNEILMDAPYRGRGYAKDLLGAFVSKLQGTYFLCHIDAINLSSNKTALRSGQTIFSQECFVKIGKA